MKKLWLWMIVTMLGIFGQISTVFAETAQWDSSYWTVDYAATVDITLTDTHYTSVGAGTIYMSFGLPGEFSAVQGYSLSLYAPLGTEEYNATIMPFLHPFSKNMESIIVRNPCLRGEGVKAAAIQTAIWKLIYGDHADGEGSVVKVYPTGTEDPSIENLATDMMKAAITDDLKVTVDAIPDPSDPDMLLVRVKGWTGLPVSLTITQGTFRKDDGTTIGLSLSGELDQDGLLLATIDLGGAGSQVTVTVDFDRPKPYVIKATSIEQDTILILRPVPERIRTTFPSVPTFPAGPVWMLR